MKQLKKPYVIFVLVVIAFGAVGYFLMKNSSSTIPDGYVLVESYVHYEEGDLACAANRPSCGVCNGEVIDNKCYVPKGSVWD
jgi:hypothetical protein